MPYPCTCCGDCVYGGDDFNRSPNDLGIGGDGLDWQVFSFIYIQANEMMIDHSNGFAAYLVAEPDGLPWLDWYANIEADSQNDESRINLSFNNVSPNFDRLFSQVKWGSAADGSGAFLSLWTRIGGVNTKLIETPIVAKPGETYNLNTRICEESGYNVLEATITQGTDPSVTLNIAIPSGFTAYTEYGGLSSGAITSGSGKSVRFDNFIAGKTHSSTNPGCPKCDCTIFEDDYSGGDNTNLGSNYTEVAGNSEVLSGRLRLPGTNHFVLIERSYSGGVTLDVYIYGSVGDILFIGLDYVDANNYVFAEFKIGGAGVAYIKLWDRVGGLNTLLTSVQGICTIYDGDLVTVCLAGNIFSAKTAVPLLNASVSWTYTTPSASRKAFLASGSVVTTAIEFDILHIQRASYAGNACPECTQDCYAICPDSEVTDIEWEIETTGYAATGGACDVNNNCAGLNDTVVATFWRTSLIAGGGGGFIKVCWWRYVYPTPIQYCDSTNPALDAFLYGRAIELNSLGQMQVYALDIDADTVDAGLGPRVETEVAGGVSCDEAEYLMTPIGLGGFRPITRCDISGRAITVRRI